MNDKGNLLAVAEDVKLLEARLTEANEARREAGLPLLSAKVRKCIQCGEKFASVEARTCNPCIKKRESE